MYVNYGHAEVLHGISLDVPNGSLVTLIGANGAGKTTTLLTISGLLKPRKGSIEFNGTAIQGRRPDVIIAMGISQCPEGRRVFPAMSVMENLEIGGYSNVKQLRERLDFCFKGTTVLLVEQNAYMALNMASSAFVLESGQITLEGPAESLLSNEFVKRAYLGL
jgi:branched-chain amino acid transport system ATP-binding protein